MGCLVRGQPASGQPLGECELADQRETEAAIERDRRHQRQRFYALDLHTMEVDFDDWMRDSERELRRGRDRAGRATAA